MRFAKCGFPEIGVFFFLFLAALSTRVWLGAVLFFPFIFALFFFRDPERKADGEGWLSPADGKVVEIMDAEHEFTGKVTKIGIFMSGTDVHVNRFPVDGTISFMKYVPGKKWFAINPKASLDNERFYIGAESADGPFMLVQIAGILARRIVCYKNMNDSVFRGERYGMIKLGSKVDIYLPNTIRPVVNVGDKVTAGKTVIGVKKN